MRAFVVIAVAVALFATLAVASSPDYVAMFQKFKKDYNRKYATPAEESKKLRNFIASQKRAAELQALNPKATFGVNNFADLSAEEFKVYHNGNAHFASAVSKHKPSPNQMKAASGKSIDWRTKGAVTPVKNQGQCGSCWSFSTTGSIEGQWFLAGHTLVSVSEQEFVSCDTIDQGCNGGLMDNAFDWIMQAHNGTTVTEASYPYVSGDGQVPACDMSGKVNAAQIYSHYNIAHNEDTMATYMYTNGPISIAADATSWQTYTGGIMTNCVSQQIDHGILIVGVVEDHTPPYWIIKNSWAASWGEAGYLYLEKGKDECLITSYPCSSLVHKGGPSPPGPTPPSPPSGSDITQKTCKEATCTDCVEEHFTAGKCITTMDTSIKMECGADALLVSTYKSKDCSGTAAVESNPLNQCSFVAGAENSFVMNECKAGPGPSPPGPTPPSPPAPTPAPSGGSFIQEKCTDSTCAQCSNYSFPLDKCLPLEGGGSAMCKCGATTLTMTEYPLSTSCTGTSIPSSMPLNKCLQANGGGYIENICPNQMHLSGMKGGKLRRMK